MSTEELLRPRYKVIIKAPGCPFKPGAIIEKHKYASGNWYIPNYMYEPEEFPDVFKRLGWYEERKPEEMPLYVKSKVGYHKVREHEIKGCHTEDGWWLLYINSTPATLAEYETYINQKKKQ